MVTAAGLASWAWLSRHRWPPLATAVVLVVAFWAGRSALTGAAGALPVVSQLIWGTPDPRLMLLGAGIVLAVLIAAVWALLRQRQVASSVSAEAHCDGKPRSLESADAGQRLVEATVNSSKRVMSFRRSAVDADLNQADSRLPEPTREGLGDHGSVGRKRNHHPELRRARDYPRP